MPRDTIPTEPYSYALDPNESPSTGVYTAVAILRGCSPLALPPLGETVDPEAIDAVIETCDDGDRPAVSFEYCEFAITATPEEVRLADGRAADGESASTP